MVYQGSGVDSSEWVSVSQEVLELMQVGKVPRK